MNDSSSSKWPTALFLFTTGSIFFGCVWYLWAGVTNPESGWRTTFPKTSLAENKYDEKTWSLAEKDRMMLSKGHGVLVNNERIVYRGRQNGMLQLDLFICQLDPHYGYPHLIPEKQAREGFRIGSHQFRVTAVSDSKVNLKHFSG